MRKLLPRVTEIALAERQHRQRLSLVLVRDGGFTMMLRLKGRNYHEGAITAF